MIKSEAKRARRIRRGFTLIELLVVITIIGILSAVVVVSIMSKPDEAKQIAAVAQIKQLNTAIGMYKLDHNGELPATLKDLVEPPGGNKESYLENTKEVPKDPWGHDYQYTVIERRHFKIVCFGKDGQEGGDGFDKDITSDNLSEFTAAKSDQKN